MSVLTRCVVALGGLALVGGALATAIPASAEPVVNATPDTVSTLALQNGWTNYGFGTRPATVTKLSGVATFSGAISTTGTNPVPFVLAPGYRPAANVYVPVDLCNATNGRLLIQSNGTVSVQTATWSNAQCFTSLDGVSYPVTTAGFSELSTINGWTGASFGTRTPGAKVLNGVVTLKGSISTSGTNSQPFTLPKAFRPNATVYVKTDMCNATNGRLIISPNGAVSVEAETDFSNAQCFTSLEGVTYGLDGSTYRGIAPINGWTGAGFSTRTPGVRVIGGIVHLVGSIETSGTSTQPFTLLPAYRPSGTVYVPVDMCGATNGRLVISSTGSVTVQAETDFSNAACFTSLDGAQYKR